MNIGRWGFYLDERFSLVKEKTNGRWERPQKAKTIAKLDQRVEVVRSSIPCKLTAIVSLINIDNYINVYRSQLRR